MSNEVISETNAASIVLSASFPVTVAERVEWHARLAPQNAALSISGPYRDTISYYRLNQFIHSAAHRLSEAEVNAGQCYGLWIEDVLLHIVVLLALERLGCISVSLTDPAPSPSVALVAILSDQDLRTGVSWIRVDQGWLSNEAAFPFPDIDQAAEGVCRIVLTSGTTGLQKGVAITRHMLADRLNSYRYVFGEAHAKHQRMLCCMGLASSIGYLFLMHTLSRGGMYCVPDPSLDIKMSPCALYRVQTVVAAPATLAEFIDNSGSPHSWPTIELVLTAGSVLPPQLAQKIRREVCANLIVFYGTTEAGVIAAAHADTLNLAAGETGFVVPGMQVKVIEPDSNGAGVLAIRGPAVAREYLAKDTLAGIFVDGWFRPGDIGCVSADNRVRILGRADNTVNLGGAKTTLEAIDQQLSAAPGVRELAVVTSPDVHGVPRIICAVVPTDSWAEERFFSFCREQVRPSYWPTRIEVLQKLPRTSSGKIDRTQLATLARINS
jgi:acyl-coenzyme A synthetase/AMP-(fatty) acid ligase